MAAMQLGGFNSSAAKSGTRGAGGREPGERRPNIRAARPSALRVLGPSGAELFSKRFKFGNSILVDAAIQRSDNGWELPGKVTLEASLGDGSHVLLKKS
jgi:hypothetical protein